MCGLKAQTEDVVLPRKPFAFELLQQIRSSSQLAQKHIA